MRFLMLAHKAHLEFTRLTTSSPSVLSVWGVSIAWCGASISSSWRTVTWKARKALFCVCENGTGVRVLMNFPGHLACHPWSQGHTTGVLCDLGGFSSFQLSGPFS